MPITSFPYLTHPHRDRQRGGATSEGGIPAQVSRLATAVLAYAKNIDRPEALISVVQRICHKHISRGVSPIQYDAVGECLLHAFQKVLQEGATPEIMTAWELGYRALANLFIDTEKNLKAHLESVAGYQGFVGMTVRNIEVLEHGKILSVVPVDVAVPPYGEGQFVAVSVCLQNGEHTMTSMKLVGEGGDCMKLEVPFSEEKASLYLLQQVEEGGVIQVSVPCGVIKKKDH